MKKIVRYYLCIGLLLGLSNTVHAGEAFSAAAERLRQWQQQPRVRQIARQLVIAAAVAGLLYGSYKTYQGLRGGLAGSASLIGQEEAAAVAMRAGQEAAMTQRIAAETQAHAGLQQSLERYREEKEAKDRGELLARGRVPEEEWPRRGQSEKVTVSEAVYPIDQQEEPAGGKGVLVGPAAEIAIESRNTMEVQGYSLTINDPTKFINTYHGLMTTIKQSIQQLSKAVAAAPVGEQSMMQIDINRYKKLQGTLLAEFSKGPWIVGQKIAASNFAMDNPTEGEASAVVWYLYSIAVQQGHAFTDGTFNIQDNGLLYAFLKKVPGVYERALTIPLAGKKILLSSHYPYIKEQLGIDIQSHEYTLPNDAHHIMFGQGLKVAEGGHMVIDNNRMFLKPEPHGIGDWYSLMQHAQGYADSWYRWYYAANEAMGYKKERVPADMLKQWGLLVNTVYPDEVSYLSSLTTWISKLFQSEHPLIKNAKTDGGLAFMNLTLPQIEKDAGDKGIDVATTVDAIREKLSRYPYLEKRQGQEVIINHDQLIDVKGWNDYWIGQFQQ